MKVLLYAAVLLGAWVGTLFGLLVLYPWGYREGVKDGMRKNGEAATGTDAGTIR